MSDWLQDFKAAVKGTEKNFTSGSIDRAIFYLAVPMILETLMESLFAVVDAYFVSNYVGVNGVAVVGLTESVITIIYAIAIGLSMAATAIVARRIGEGNPEAAAVSAVQAILLSAVISISLGLAGFWFAEEILKLMGAEQAVIDQGGSYTKILFGSNIVILFLFLLNGIFRGAGDAAIAMRSLWLANILNIILDPCFILGLWIFPEMGVAGAAVATTIGRGVGVCYQLYVLFKGNSLIKVKLKHFRLQLSIIWKLMRVGFTGILQFLVASASWIWLMRIMADFGSQAVAGYTISIRVIIFTLLPAWGMANAAATLVGQNLGAKQPERAEKSVWKTAHYTMLFMLAVAILYYFLSEPIIRFFLDDEIAVREGIVSLRIFCLGYVFFAYGMVMGNAFNGAGDTWTPTKINFLAFWLLQIPLAYYLANSFGWGTNGVYWAVAISESVLAVVSILIFRRGRWKLQQV